MLMSPSLPGAAKAIQTLGTVDARYLLRHEVGEINRTIFEYWGLAQLAFGVILFFLLLFGTTVNYKLLGVSAVMVLLVGINQFAVLPSIIGLGRAVEFSDIPKFPSQRQQLAAMHTVYTGFECLKVLTGLGLAALLVFSRADRKRRGRRASDLNAIDHADYSHINR